MRNDIEGSASNKVSLEELLRVKRAEHPSPEFWSRFEEDLRIKQLAAIVEKRPWWVTLRLPQVGRGLALVRVPAGVAAAVALGLFVAREYRDSADFSASFAAVGSGQPAAAAVTAPSSVSVDQTVEADSVATAPVSVANVATSPDLERRSLAAAHVAVAEHAALSHDSSMATGSGALLAMIPWAAPRTGIEVGANEERPNLGELPAVHFASALSSARDHDFNGSVEVGSVVVTPPVVGVSEELAEAQVSPVSPREVRRSRILSGIVLADNSDQERVRLAQRDGVAGSLDESRLYDSVHRVGMGGDRFTLKF